MSYTVNKTSGAVLTTIADGTIDTTTDLTLIGKNYAGYGEILNEDFVKLLENFANSSAPSAPIAGQLFWNTSSNLMQVYTGTAWKTISSSTASASQPSNAVTGDLWWDTTNSQLKVYNGTSFTLIGPAFTTGTGQSGPVIDTVTDSLGSDHVVVKMYVSDAIVGIVSKDAQFTPQTAISGFATISPGYNLSTTVSGAKYNGESDDASTLSGLTSTQFLRSDATDTTSGALTIANDTGITVGSDSDFTVSVSGSDVTLRNTTSDGDINFNVNDGGSNTKVMYIDGATSHVLPGTTTTHNLGSASLVWANVYATTFNGTSTQAQYADVAENFAADATYEPGTIVALGGVEEITKAGELDENVFGVVSTAPAHLMNAGLEGGTPVALTGRCPVRIVGSVKKGDRLVSAGDGLARAALPGEATAFNTIGRALEDGQEIIEAFVTVN